MTYKRTNWTSGDVITSEKLNNAEAGIESAEEAAAEAKAAAEANSATLTSQAAKDAEHDAVFICCYVEDDYVEIFCRLEHVEINCRSGYFPKTK